MKRMLFNATHQEELRVAIVDGQKLIDLDIETAGREQRKGNIYKGVITRIEPGLEACFVNYGEDRHGFLPFKEVARSYFKEGVDVRSARIQDALTEGQELIVQVEKEERGNKGAALTTFISLAGRYLVLMPNNPRGGGVSRRVEGEDRQELRETMEQLDIPQGMSIIARTAGIGRSVEELQWDLSYLMQLWTAIDGAARDNKAPILIYLESSLVIRAIRDYFSPEIGEILIDTDDVADQASAFMSVVMPDNLHRVKMYRDDVPLFSRFQIEHQIETAYSRTVQLPSGGSVVIDHTEALVAVDVNSARSTRGSDIEETALRTNQEAADEVARQLRLRDLGGLIVIDFIDMEDSKNQRAVEQRLRDALHFDRARVQMGKISRFGLMELSRQRLRPALNEGSHVTCPRCNGTGVIRDAESSALQVLRLIQEEAMKENTAAVHAQVPVDVAAFLLNEKRADIAKMEARLKVNLVLIPNKHLETPHHNIERLRHDDPRLEEVKPSFELAEAPSTDLSWAPREQEVKTKPEALVKGITPAQPAPISAPAATAAASGTGGIGGLFKKLFSWLSGGDSKPTPEAKPAESARPAGSGNRNRRDGQGRNGERRNGRRNERRADDTEGTRNEDSQRRGRGQRRDRQEADRDQTALNGTSAANNTSTGPANDRNTSDAANDNGSSNRRGRNRRRGGRRDDATDAQLSAQEEKIAALASSMDEVVLDAKATAPRAEAAAVAAEPTATADTTNEVVTPAAGDEQQADPERKRRRRRSRRGRRSGEDATSTDNQASADSNETSTDNGAAVAAVASEAVAAPITVAAEPVVEPTPVVSAPIEPVVTAPQTSAEAPAPQVAPEPVATQVVAPAQPEAVAPAVSPAPAAETVATPAPAVQVEAASPAADTPASTVEATPAVVAEAAAPVSQEPAPVETVTSQPEPVAVEPVAQETVAAQAEPLEPVATTAQVVETAQAEPAATPAAAPTADIIVPAAQGDRSALDAVVRAAGMQWVETDPARLAQSQASLASSAPIRLGREPRVQAPVSNQPLQQVETQH